jgi:SAM-dependent methyltransferase
MLARQYSLFHIKNRSIIMTALNCPLCQSTNTHLLHQQQQSKKQQQLQQQQQQNKIYNKCNECTLIFLLPQFYLNQKDEKARYDEHNNVMNDGYKNFLSIAINSLLPHITRESVGLDFGCGPNPALSQIMKEEYGIQHVSNYDVYYHCNDELITNREHYYDFIISTEVVEHLYEPIKQFTLLNQLLKPGGHLCIMTGMKFEEKQFGNWWYIRDPTHVVFYQHSTMQWIAQHFGLQVQFPHVNVALFHK